MEPKKGGLEDVFFPVEAVIFRSHVHMLSCESRHYQARFPTFIRDFRCILNSSLGRGHHIYNWVDDVTG